MSEKLKCNKCGIEYEKDEYRVYGYSKKNGKPLFDKRCKICLSSKSKDYRNKNPEKIKEFKAYVKENLANKFKLDEAIIFNEKKFDKFISDALDELTKTNYYLNSSINVTTIVHLNHYMIAFNTLKLKPFGYGFQNYEKATIEFSKKNTLSDDYSAVTYLNKNDGSNNFNKLLVEFSYLNILLVVLFFIFNFKTNLNNPSKVFIFSIIITQLFRAAGYFNGGFLFVIVMGFFSIFIQQKK